MENFMCEVSFEGIADSYAPEETVEITARVLRTNSPINTVALTLPLFGLHEKFKRVSDDVFALTMPIPYDAPSGTFEVVFKAIDVDGDRVVLLERMVSIA